MGEKAESKKFKSIKHILSVIITSIITSVITCSVTLTFNAVPNFIAEQAILSSSNGEASRFIYIYNTKYELKNANAKIYYNMHFYGYNNTERVYPYYISDNHNFNIDNMRFSFYEDPNSRYHSLGEAFMYVYEDTHNKKLLPKIDIYIEINYDNIFNRHRKKLYKLNNNQLVEIKGKEAEKQISFFELFEYEQAYESLWDYYASNREYLGIYSKSDRTNSGKEEAEEKFNNADDFVEYVESYNEYYGNAAFLKKIYEST